MLFMYACMLSWSHALYSCLFMVSMIYPCMFHIFHACFGRHVLAWLCMHARVRSWTLRHACCFRSSAVSEKRRRLWMTNRRLSPLVHLLPLPLLLLARKRLLPLLLLARKRIRLRGWCCADGFCLYPRCISVLTGEEKDAADLEAECFSPCDMESHVLACAGESARKAYARDHGGPSDDSNPEAGYIASLKPHSLRSCPYCGNKYTRLALQDKNHFNEEHRDCILASQAAAARRAALAAVLDRVWASHDYVPMSTRRAAITLMMAPSVHHDMPYSY